MADKPARPGTGNAIGPGERAGPGFEGVRCPSCDAFLRVKPGAFGDEFACPCGCVFELDSLGCAPTEPGTLAAAGPATMGGAAPARLKIGPLLKPGDPDILRKLEGFDRKR